MYIENLLYSLRDFLIALDRVGNALTGGNHTATVSGRVGYFSKHKRNPYWAFLEWVIDSTFYPIEGKGHCAITLEWEKGKNIDYDRGNDLGLALLSILVIAACLILAPIIYIISLFD